MSDMTSLIYPSNIPRQLVSASCNVIVTIMLIRTWISVTLISPTIHANYIRQNETDLGRSLLRVKWDDAYFAHSRLRSEEECLETVAPS